MTKKSSYGLAPGPSIDVQKLDSRAEFPVRENIRPDESGHGYALRMAEANHIGGLPVLKNWLGKTRFAVLDESDAEKLSQWFGADPLSLANALGATGFKKQSTNISLAGQKLGRFYFVNRMHPRICPLCLSTSRYCRAAWDMTLTTACPIHGILLTHQCQMCQRSLTWERPAVDICQCGWSLSLQANTAAVTRTELEISAWVTSKFGSSEQPVFDTARIEGLNSPLGRLLHPLTLNGGLHLLHALGAAARTDDSEQVPPIREKSSIAAAQEILTRACLAVEQIRRGEPAAIRVSKLSVIIQLLAESASAQVAPADRSLAHSLITAFLHQGGRSNWKSRYPQLSQLELF